MSDSDLARSLSPEVYRHLQTYQQQQGQSSLEAALNHLLQGYFSEQRSDIQLPSEAQRQVESLENRVYTLTREVMLLRQSVPDQCDRLREQLAAVRLSHSGLLQNLRQRLEVLEQGAVSSGSQDTAPIDPGSISM